MQPIEFWAVVNKVQTLADGGIRVALDLPEQFVVQMAELAACKIHGQVLDVSLTEHGLIPLTDLNDEAKKGAEGGGPKVDRHRTAIRRDKRTGC